MGWVLPSAATAATFATISTISIPGRESPARRRKLARRHLRQLEPVPELGCVRDSVGRGLRPWPIAAVTLSLLPLVATALLRPRPLLVWNASASSPLGLYAVGPADLRQGQMALAWAPVAARRLAALRHYLPYDVPLVKNVSAVAGARVCANGDVVLVDGRPAAVRLKHDRSGRTMPWWSGCRRLRQGDLFLLSGGVPDAFDGRYFGVTRKSEVIGRARLIWRR
ncbi:MAG TPA: S26 family signal peptidase [Sphingomicrobium sp.]|nr:S26 family signal peptidase [Sphingomicrobium sp.]